MAWLSAFAGTTFKHSVLLDQTWPEVADKKFGKAMRRAGVATNTTSFQQLGRGARALKSAVEGNRGKMREQRFYQYEIRTRAHRRDLGVLSRAFTSLYVHARDCGLSVKRPLLVLLGLAALMALVYLEVGLAAAVPRGGVPETAPGAIEYSLARALPLTLWEKPTVGTPLRIALAQPWTGVLVRFAAVLQSASSAVLFLSALVARRQFQIQ